MRFIYTVMSLVCLGSFSFTSSGKAVLHHVHRDDGHMQEDDYSSNRGFWGTISTTRADQTYEVKQWSPQTSPDVSAFLNIPPNPLWPGRLLLSGSYVDLSLIPRGFQELSISRLSREALTLEGALRPRGEAPFLKRFSLIFFYGGPDIQAVAEAQFLSIACSDWVNLGKTELFFALYGERDPERHTGLERVLAWSFPPPQVPFEEDAPLFAADLDAEIAALRGVAEEDPDAHD